MKNRSFPNRDLKTRILPWIVGVATTLIAVPGAHAGGSSHGGIAYVCRDGAGTVTEARLLDLWEPEESSVAKSDLPWREQLDSALARIADFHPTVFDRVSEELARLEPLVFYTEKQLPLSTADVLPQYQPEPGCALEQLADYGWINERQAEGLRVNRTLYQDPALSETDRAALRLHEALYALERQGLGSGDSLRTRAIVAAVFGTRPLGARIEGALVDATLLQTRDSTKVTGFRPLTRGKLIEAGARRGKVIELGPGAPGSLHLELLGLVDTSSIFSYARGSCQYRIELGSTLIAEGEIQIRGLSGNDFRVRKSRSLQIPAQSLRNAALRLTTTCRNGAALYWNAWENCDRDDKQPCGLSFSSFNRLPDETTSSGARPTRWFDQNGPIELVRYSKEH